MTDYFPAVRLSVIAEGQLSDIEIARHPVLLVRIGDDVHAASNVCPHAGSPLSHGRLIGGTVQCPMHGIRFRLADGGVVGRPVCDNLQIYPVRIRDGMVEVAVPDEAPISP